MLILLLKALYAFVIHQKCNCDNKKTKNVLTYLSIPFPIITGIVCLVRYRKSTKDIFTVLITLIFTLVSTVAIGTMYGDNTNVKYYDKDGTSHTYLFDMRYTDADGNVYTYNYNKSGYDYFYINSTDNYLDADFCYLDENGYFYYDDDMSISAKDETCCVDEDGSIYYAAKNATFNKDGTIKYKYNSDNFAYDRLGKAYTYRHVPYYDKEGNKYLYSFDSKTQKGYYTNISTQKTYENEYSFVDEDGYFVYDEEHNFERQENIENVRTYKDSSGKIYYWASNISWDKDGNLLDIYGEIIK